MCQAHQDLDEAFRKAMDEKFDLSECHCGECCKSSHNETSPFETVALTITRLALNPFTWYIVGVIDAGLVFLLAYALLVR